MSNKRQDGLDAVIFLRVDKKRKEAIRIESDIENRSMSNFILNAVDEYLFRKTQK